MRFNQSARRSRVPDFQQLDDTPSPLARRSYQPLGITRARSFSTFQKPHGREGMNNTQSRHPKMRRLENGSKQAVTTQNTEFNPSHFVRSSQSRAHVTLRNDLVRPLNNSDVAARGSYSSATIARDILVVAAKHPTERSLNEHLEALHKNISSVTFKSDLQTFRWDLVDPVASSVETESHSNTRQWSSTEVRPLDRGLRIPLLQSSPGTQPQPRVPTAADLVLSSRSCYFRSPQELSNSTVTNSYTTPHTPVGQTGTETASARKISQSTRSIDHLSSSSSRSPLQPVVIIPSSPFHTPVPMQINQSNQTERNETLSSPRSATKHQIYPCQWVNCQTKLRSLQAVQSHVMKHILHSLNCGWIGCSHSNPMSASDMWEHLMQNHLISITGPPE